MKAKRFVLAMTSVAIVALTASIFVKVDVASAREYLRVEGDLETTIADRQVYWERGLERVTVVNVLGTGPLGKFSSGGPLFGYAYDRESNAHNTFLSVVQYYGVPAGVLCVVFIILLFATLLRRKDELSILGLSLLTFGLAQSVSENWLLSFGTPSDLYSWLILGLTCASRPDTARNPDNESEPGYPALKLYAIRSL